MVTTKKTRKFKPYETTNRNMTVALNPKTLSMKLAYARRWPPFVDTVREEENKIAKSLAIWHLDTWGWVKTLYPW